MNQKFVISEASFEDAKQISEIEKQNFSMPWSEKSILDSMKQDNYIFLKAEYENNIVGYVGFYYSLDEGDITNIAVTPSFRRLGIGRQLLLTLISECKKRNIASIMLEVRISNDNAIDLYKKTGFSEIGIRKNFYEKPVEDAILMKCIIDRNCY